MISIFDKHNKLNEHKNSLNITYPRNVNIIFGTYPYPDVIHNLIIQIKNNLSNKLNNYTNVKGGMTDWYYFLDKPEFKNFITYLINKHQTSNPDIFQYFLERRKITNAWGNEIKNNDSLIYHEHPCLHGILYLTTGCDLILPELNIKITPSPGDYYIFPACILHGFDKSENNANRYSLIFNIEQNQQFDFDAKLKEINDRTKR